MENCCQGSDVIMTDPNLVDRAMGGTAGQSTRVWQAECNGPFWQGRGRTEGQVDRKDCVQEASWGPGSRAPEQARLEAIHATYVLPMS